MRVLGSLVIMHKIDEFLHEGNPKMSIEMAFSCPMLGFITVVSDEWEL